MWLGAAAALSIALLLTCSPAGSSVPSCAPIGQPTYFPWGSEARKSTTPDGRVHYEGPLDERQLPTSFAIGDRADVNDLPKPPEARTVQVGGLATRIFWVGDPGVGAVGAWWEVGAACGYREADLVWRRGTQSNIEDELVKVIASLR